MRYYELKYRDKVYTNPKDIHDILFNEKFYWLIDSEIENAQLEIKNNTIILGGMFLYLDLIHFNYFNYSVKFAASLVCT